MKNILIHTAGYIGLFIFAQLLVLSVVGISPFEFLTDIACLIRN